MEKLPYFRAKLPLLFGTAGLGLFLLGVGVLTSLVLSRRDWKNVQVIENTPAKKEEKAPLIAIDVSGAVQNPGVFNLPIESRVQDALAMAGGLSATADRNWVSRNINLAQRVSDGVKIYIPKQGESLGTHIDIQGIVTTEGKISVNSSTVSELQGLWGVGEARAEAIINGRPYGNINELVTKKILSRSILEKNKNKLSL